MRPETTDLEQTVGITLGPKGTFKNVNIGTLMHRVPADRVVSAFPLEALGALGPFSMLTVRRAFTHAAEHVGLRGVRPYDLRHSYGTAP